MGLDMFLNKKTYIGAQYEHNKVTGTIDIKMDGKKVPIQLNRVAEISENVAYWRKANQIHKWFVENIQGGEDDCGEYYVRVEYLQKLVEECNVMINKLNNTPKIKKTLLDWDKKEYEVEVYDIKEYDNISLPTQKGFFFGNTEYDEWYLRELQDTVAQLTPLIKEGEGIGSFYYSSSW